VLGKKTVTGLADIAGAAHGGASVTGRKLLATYVGTWNCAMQAAKSQDAESEL